MTTANAIPQPLPGEIQVDYYSRVFSLLDGETDEKNAAILAAWDQSEEARKLDGIAAKKFPVEKFSRGSMVPVFTEHTTVRRTVDANGNQIEEPVVWDRDRLAAMCYQMNHRIRDTGSFSPITEGHTPDKFARDKGCPQPAVLGYQGKFRMGLIGNIDPKWTIFCDEYRHAEDAEKFQKLTRRSPEVWTAAEKPFFDPCAALGAETPRLDMGTSLAYSREGYWQSIGDDGAEVDKYSMGVATFPGPGNVSMPEHVKVKDNYEAGQDPDGDEAGDDVNQIIEAVMNALQPVIEQFQILQPMIPTLQKLAVGAELPEKPDNAGAAPPAGTAAPAAEGDKVAAPAAPVQKPAEPNPQPHVAGHQPPPVAPEAKPQVQPQELADDDKAMMVKYMAGQCT